ncbi:hypothetical protein CA233_19055 [Sphingomonas sp. ABOLD]|uniref:Uncharacterized protein n=1 Tax=Sphingomonas trueperi TaxID=53317 RepID=A0A7X5Y2G4_9SPHN|nr:MULTISPECIES: hypothetical protein [Sphingomonas]NJB99400.1 hypothetical protein [Sphingomonas trueperi]RSV34844.1 hypothetical protein CA234_20690 [Sphingomonas sp. ABOLE]RSV40938.1 hypothetical protein CA233_19055 [Sphingomonas sp. ABOLD]
MKRENDIKAPDGYTLGGVRTVRRDGTILFNRGYWKAPDDWVGESVWVHEAWVTVEGKGERLFLEAAQPGLHIYDARGRIPPWTVLCEGADRKDAKTVRRRAE